jgi:hypothetical protein
MQRRVLKGERSEAFASGRVTKDDYILRFAFQGYGPDEIKWKMWQAHAVHISRDYIKQLMKRSGFYGPA